MNKQLAIPAIVALTVAMVLGMMSPALADHKNVGDDNGEKKVIICHITSDHTDTKTITVSEKALEAHLAHGDSVGDCDEGPDPIPPGPLPPGGEL